MTIFFFTLALIGHRIHVYCHGVCLLWPVYHRALLGGTNALVCCWLILRSVYRLLLIDIMQYIIYPLDHKLSNKTITLNDFSWTINVQHTVPDLNTLFERTAYRPNLCHTVCCSTLNNRRFRTQPLVTPGDPLTSTKNNKVLLLNVVHPLTKYEIGPSYGEPNVP